MEEQTFMQQVRRIYQRQEGIYNRDRAVWYESEHRLLEQSVRQGRVGRAYATVFHDILNYMQSLTFQQMLAFRTVNTRQTVARIGDQAGNKIADDELLPWRSVESILHAAHVDEVEIWLLNLLYLKSAMEGAKRAPSTVEQPIPRKLESPDTEPLSPRNRIRRSLLQRAREIVDL